MTNTRLFGIALLAVLALGARSLADDQTEAAEDRAAANAKRLAALIDTLKTADNPSAAMAAYARGCGIDRTNVELQNAYMRKMLTFGLPKISYYAARVLVGLQPDNGTAWGVVGYMHGRRGELGKALAASIRAAEKAPEDPSIAHNAGQLLGWYENELTPPRLPDSARRILEQILDDLFRQESFVKAHQQMKAAYVRQAALAAEIEKRLAAAAADADRVHDEALDIDLQLRTINDEIDYHNSVIESLYRELNYYYAYPVYTSDGIQYVYVPNYRYGQRAEILERIRAEERAIYALELGARKLRRRGQTVLAELRRKQRALETLRKQVRGALTQVERAFRWDPPAVDGVVTAELERFPLRPRVAAGPEDRQAIAEHRLELAKLYLSNGMTDKAVAILNELVEKYGSTPQAEEAKIVLATLKPLE